MRKLAWTAVVFTFLQMLLGTRLSGPGHHLLVATASAFSLAAVILNRSEILGLTRKNLLSIWTLQLAVALLPVPLAVSFSFIAGIIPVIWFGSLLALASQETWGASTQAESSPKMQSLIRAASLTMLLQLSLGAILRQGQMGLACPSFPGCSTSFFPDGGAAWLAFAHRGLGIAMLGLFIHMAAEASRTSPQLVAATRQAFMISMMQVLLGIGTVMTGLHARTQMLHIGAGYLLWGIVAHLWVRAGVKSYSAVASESKLVGATQ